MLVFDGGAAVGPDEAACSVSEAIQTCILEGMLWEAIKQSVSIAMHFAAVAAALALAGSALAAPAPISARNGAENYNVPQHQIQDLEVTIVNIINDIVQSNGTAYDADFAHGRDQFNTIINELQGPKSCGPHLPPVPNSKLEAIADLQNSTQGLQQLSLDLLNPANTVAKSSFLNDICWAKNAFFAVGPFHP
ncbi:hypothetical protein LTR53_009862 [Teratosphaeriaceae sp. CCFEE 6253]|nr:hypothetical protein LTR53_009862 [Teratosphaeriaceae sp. CCFEE 6253]